MRKTFALLLALCMSATLWAQKQLNASEAATVEKAMQTQTAKITTIKSDFKQTKHVSGMSKDLTSNGNMMYKKENKVILNYTSPLKYRMVINGNKVLMDNNGKKKVYNANGNAGSSEMQTMISACMTGNMESLKKNYKLTYYEQGQNYLVKIVPITQKKAFKEIDMEMRKSDKMLIRLRLTENAKAGKSGNDYTEYTFSNTVTNAALQDDLFKVE